ncbi:MAG: DsbA family protein [Rhizobiaceae bacterium]|jgi:protein-disulfide isomerase|nr:DsbA family protein [Rhizobiaceae bacterium]
MNPYVLAFGGSLLGAAFFTAGLWAARPAAEPAVVSIEAPAADATHGMSGNADFDAAIRAFLERHPEVVVEAQQRHAANQEALQAEQVRMTLLERRDELLGDPASSVLGNPEAKLTLVEFFDYNCGYCRRGHGDIVEVLERFPDVKVVLRQFPILGPQSAEAHQVAQAFQTLHPDKFRAFHDGLLTSAGTADAAAALALAVSLGADEAKLREAMASPAINEAFQRTYTLASALNITGTPSYVLGDEVIGGAVGIETLAEKIEALAAAN